MDLPKKLLETTVAENTTDGSVIKVFCDDLKGQPKSKYLVIVSKSTCGTYYGCIYINSDNYPNVNNTHILKQQQLDALKSNCQFLEHDSFFDCSNIKQNPIGDINTILEKEPKRMVGKVSAEDHKSICMTLSQNITISNKVKKLFYLISG